MIRVCRECGVERLVYTGSADVVYDGMRDVVDGDESLPYPDKVSGFFLYNFDWNLK